MKRGGWGPELGDALNLSVPLKQPPVGLEDRILGAVEIREKKLRPRAFVIPGLLAATLLLAAGNLVQWVAQPTMNTLKAGFTVVMLNGTKAAPQAFGTIVLDLADNHGVLAVRDLPVLAAGGRYELWLEKGDQVRSAGGFEVNSDGYGSLSLTVPAGFAGFNTFFVCRGSPEGTPMRPWLMTGKL